MLEISTKVDVREQRGFVWFLITIFNPQTVSLDPQIDLQKKIGPNCLAEHEFFVNVVPELSNLK